MSSPPRVPTVARKGGGDGLDDAREAGLGTSANSVDSDGDGIGDGEEVDERLDPTVFDYTPPRFLEHVANAGKNLEWSWEIVENTTYVSGSFRVHDPAGVNTTEVRHDTATQEQWTYAEAPVDVEEEFTYSRTAGETGIDGLTGFQTRLVATDVHGNPRVIVAQEYQSGVVLNAENLGLTHVPGVASDLGLIAGFSAGGGETIVGVQAAASGTASFAGSLYADPVGTAEALEASARNLTKLENASTYLHAIAQHYEQQMETANPYDPETENESYHEFRRNYYAGILLFEAAFTVGTWGVGQTVKSSTYATRVSKAVQGTKIARAVRVATRTYRGATAPVRFTKRKLALAGARAASSSLEATKRLYAKAPSVGATARVRYHLARTDVDVDSLTEAQQRALGELYSTADPGAARAVRRMDQDALEDLTKLDVDADTRRQLAPTYAELDTTERQQLGSLIDGDADAASNAGDLTPSGVRAALDYACNSPCSVQLDSSSPTWYVGDDVRAG